MKFKQSPDGYWMPVPDVGKDSGRAGPSTPAAQEMDLKQEESDDDKRPVGRPRKPKDE